MNYAKENNLLLENEMIEFERAGRPLKERKSFQEFLHNTLKNGDKLVISTLEILGETMEEGIVVINCMLTHSITLHIVQPNLIVDKKTGLSQILPLIMQLEQRQRINERDNKIGRPKGRKSASKFDIYLPQIMAGLKEDKSVSALARDLKVSRSSLKDYIQSRHLKEIIDDSWLERAKRNHQVVATKKPKMACTLKLQ